MFTANLPLKLFGATVANADTASLKFLHTLFNTCLDHIQAKFKPNRMVQKLQNVELYDKKTKTKTKTKKQKKTKKRFLKPFGRVKWYHNFVYQDDRKLCKRDH